MQARWGSHGDYEIIALCPNSPQECFDLTITAFNLSEKYRVPVFFMMDECVGHMTEKVVIPPAKDIEVGIRKYTKKKPEDYLPFEYGENLVPDMVKAGDGYFFHVTGLTHDEKGYPIMDWKTQETCVHRIIDKIQKNADDIIMIEEENIEKAEVIVISYGITSRVALRAIQMAEESGLKNLGRLRLLTIWPFPEQRIRELAKKVKAFVVPEMNYGQMVLEVERCAAGNCKSILVPHGGGTVHEPETILKAIQEAYK
jgi:2-oxoglutarate ferredoxin oxidoreductase subunit alpha